MDVFKLRPEDDGSIRLTDQNYRRATSNDEPWVTEKGGHPAHYAVCPNCDNPTVVVNLDANKTQGEDKRPQALHARHKKGDVAGVAKYNQDAYDNCFLANKHAFTGTPIKRKPGDLSHELLTILVEEADTVKSFMESVIGITIPEWLFKEILVKFVDQEGFLYRAIGKLNLPYAVLFMAKNQLVAPKRDACRIKKPQNGNSSPFVAAIEKSKYFEIGQFDRIGAKKSAPMGVRLNFFFDQHIIPRDESEPQILNMVIEEEYNGEKKLLTERKIRFDLHYFYNTVAKRRRDRKAARSILQPIIDRHPSS
jgi:hypothetical protein